MTEALWTYTSSGTSTAAIQTSDFAKRNCLGSPEDVTDRAEVTGAMVPRMRHI